MVPPPVERISGSLPTFPRRMTLLTLFAMFLPHSDFWSKVYVSRVYASRQKCSKERPRESAEIFWVWRRLYINSYAQQYAGVAGKSGSGVSQSIAYCAAVTVISVKV